MSGSGRGAEPRFFGNPEPPKKFDGGRVFRLVAIWLAFFTVCGGGGFYVLRQMFSSPVTWVDKENEKLEEKAAADKAVKDTAKDAETRAAAVNVFRIDKGEVVDWQIPLTITWRNDSTEPIAALYLEMTVDSASGRSRSHFSRNKVVMAAPVTPGATSSEALMIRSVPGNFERIGSLEIVVKGAYLSPEDCPDPNAPNDEVE